MSNNEKHLNERKELKNILKILLPSMLIIGFVGSIVCVIFSSPELYDDNNKDNETTKGLLRINAASYRNQYFEGETFNFDKSSSKITLVAKDPAIEDIVKIDNLPAPEYGFIIEKTVDENGDIVTSVSNDSTQEETTSSYVTTYSDFILNANEITVSKDMGTIYLVSKRYNDLRYPLDIKVYSALSDDDLTNSLTLEAEKADLYRDNELLNDETKINNSYYSNVGTGIIDEERAANLSGGACCRNFGTSNMLVDFGVISNVESDVSFTTMFCLRPTGGRFGNFYRVKINDEICEDIENQDVPNGQAGNYFTPTTLQANIHLNKGFNHITFESGSNVSINSPFNLDAIKLEATENCLFSLNDLIEKE